MSRRGDSFQVIILDDEKESDAVKKAVFGPYQRECEAWRRLLTKKLKNLSNSKLSGIASMIGKSFYSLSSWSSL